MRKLAAIAVATATLAVVGLNTGVATASGGGSSGGSSGTWPSAYPLPTDPGTLLSQSSTTASVRSTDQVLVVTVKLDDLYVTQKGCVSRLAVNKPRDYLCYNPSTRETDEIIFLFAALDPTAADPSTSQTTAFYVKG